MVPAILITVFLATVLATGAVFLWLDIRRQSLPRRVKEVVAPTTKAGRNLVPNIKELAAGLWRRFMSKTPGRDEILSLFLGGELTGARLLLNQAGYRNPMAHRIFLWVRVALPAFLAAAIVAAGTILRVSSGAIFALVLLGVAAGILLPIQWLKSKVRQRREMVEDALPDALDLLSVCVDAGLGLNSSIVKITEEFTLSSPPLSEEFDIVNREIVAGKPRQEAFRSLADRTGVEDVKSFVAMLIQTEKLGTSLSQSLRVHSDSLRTKRRQRAEEAAAKTTVKLVFPLVFLLFPALFIVLLGPGIIQVFHALFSTIHG